MKKTIFYVITQKTTVNKERYDEEADHHFTDDLGYYPLQKEVKSLLFSAMQTYGEGIAPIFEIMFGLDKVRIDDSKYQLGSVSR